MNNQKRKTFKTSIFLISVFFLTLGFNLSSCTLVSKNNKSAENSKEEKNKKLKDKKSKGSKKIEPKVSSRNISSIEKTMETQEKMYPYLDQESPSLKNESQRSDQNELKGKLGKKRVNNKNKKTKWERSKDYKGTSSRSSVSKNELLNKTSEEEMKKKQLAYEIKKKTFQIISESLDSKVHVLFLPVLHYEKNKLKKQVSSIYKKAIEELKRIYSFILSEDALLIKKILPHKELKQKDSSFSSSNESFFKEKNEEILNEQSDYIGSVPSYLKSFFKLREEEYDLKSLVFLLSKSGKVDVLVEGKIFQYDIEPIKESSGFYSFIKLRGVLELRVRLASIKSGRIIWEERKTITAFDKTRNLSQFEREKILENHSGLAKRTIWNAFSKIFPSLIRAFKKLTWNGRVAFVSKDRIYINAGKPSGIEIGDLMQVKKNGIEIFDPETGEFIGKAPGEIKGIIKVIQHFGKNGSIAVMEKGELSNIEANDKVEIF